jgi:hypothetical protein
MFKIILILILAISCKNQQPKIERSKSSSTGSVFKAEGSNYKKDNLKENEELKAEDQKNNDSKNQKFIEQVKLLSLNKLPFFFGYYTYARNDNWPTDKTSENELDEISWLGGNALGASTDVVVSYSSGLFEKKWDDLLDKPNFDQVIEEHKKQVTSFLNKSLSLNQKVIFQLWNVPQEKINEPSYLNSHPKNGTLAIIKNLVQEYSSHPAIIGWNIIEEPILALEKSADPVKQYAVLKANLMQIKNTVKENDSSGKFIFGVFARWEDNSSVPFLKDKTQELVKEIFDVWGQNSHPFLKVHKPEYLNIWDIKNNAHKLENFQFQLNTKFASNAYLVSVTQAFGADSMASSTFQRLPTFGESLFQNLYLPLIFSERSQGKILGLVSWAYRVTKASPALTDMPYAQDGTAWLKNVYPQVKQVVDFAGPILKDGLKKKTFQLAVANPKTNSDWGLYGALFYVPSDLKIFQSKAYSTHPWAGRLVLIAYNTENISKNFTFILDEVIPQNIKTAEAFVATPSAKISFLNKKITVNMLPLKPVIISIGF